MKNLLFLIGLSMIFLYSCAKEEITVNDLDGVKIENRAPLPKMDVCHYDAEFDTWHVININMNAWPAHEAHGDVRLDDPDGDGFFPFNECGYEPMGDCNDFDATIYPGAEEICGDGIDQDCDGVDAACVIPCWDVIYDQFIEDMENDGIQDMWHATPDVCGYGVTFIGISTGDCGNGSFAISVDSYGNCGYYILNGSGWTWSVIDPDDFPVLYQQIYDLALAYGYPIPDCDNDLYHGLCPGDYQGSEPNAMSSNSIISERILQTGEVLVKQMK